MIPRIPMGEAAVWFENFLVDNFDFLFSFIRDVVNSIVGFIQNMLHLPVYWVAIAIALVAILHLNKKTQISSLTLGSIKLNKISASILYVVLTAILYIVLNLFLASYIAVNIAALALLFMVTKSTTIAAIQVLSYGAAFLIATLAPEVSSPFMFAAFIAYLSYVLSGKGVAIFAGLGILLINNINLWSETVETLSLILTSTLLALLISIPLGILAAKNDRVDAILRPILDFMQTMPAFVYLIPAVVLFDIGYTPAAVATIIFAMPPAIRLTNLGIRQVPQELVEAGKAFGSTPTQMLFKIQLPQAMPTIMAGINQCIMLSLSMVVIASMIGARGLGSVVMRGVSQLETGVGFEGGIAVVIIAIILDRLTQGVSK
ncbi:ABC transporter permease subunit [Proteinivorax tanatarense]|uniref:ABC transporter permease subunit n=1 Tax=Proteinivorax tanatarense TaxID=1260629 RepID=A0AAU7VM70_9FIRM